MSANPGGDGWASFHVDFLDSTDWKTVAMVLGNLRAWNLRLTVREDDELAKALVQRFGVATFDINLVDPSAVQDDEGGIEFHPINDDGDRTGPNAFIAYEHIERLGVY